MLEMGLILSEIFKVKQLGHALEGKNAMTFSENLILQVIDIL